MRNLISLIVVSTIVLTTTSCQKEKLEKLSGVWQRDGDTDSVYERYTFTCNSVKVESKYAQQDTVQIKYGTYDLKKDFITFHFDVPYGYAPSYGALVDFKAKKMYVEIPYVDCVDPGACATVFSKTQDIKCE